jgi:hypothetical protein
MWKDMARPASTFPIGTVLPIMFALFAALCQVCRKIRITDAVMDKTKSQSHRDSVTLDMKVCGFTLELRKLIDICFLGFSNVPRQRYMSESSCHLDRNYHPSHA